MATLDDLLKTGQASVVLQRKTMEGVQRLVELMGRFKGGSGSGSGTGSGTATGKKPKALARFTKWLEGTGRLGRGLVAAGRALGYVGAGAAVAAAALASIPIGMIAITKAVQPFVRALNPSSVEALERAQTNLAATIGYAFTPVIAYATQAVREFSGILLPALRKLKPGIEKVSRAFIGVAHAVGQIASMGIERLAQILEGAGTGIALFVESVATATETFFAAMNALFVGVFGTEFDDLGDAFETLGKWIGDLTEFVAIGAGTFAKFFGATETFAALQRALNKSLGDRENPKEGLTAAPTDVHTGGAADLVKRLNERAYVATQADPTKKTDNAILKEIADSMNIVAGFTGEQIVTKVTGGIVNGLSEWWREAKTEPPLSLLDGPRNAINDAGSTIKGGFQKVEESSLYQKLNKKLW